jgi:predicted O-methyltransferase YrrM
MRASRIAQVTSVHPYWGMFLYLCASAVGAETILELGSCAGISGCYVASGTHCRRFITVEGSPELARLAEANIRQVASHAEVVNALFDDALDAILPTLGKGLDMAYIDGQHEKRSTLHYFKRLVPHLSSGAVVVFDDIQWSPDMWEAWQELSRWPGVSHAINVGRFGVCVWDGAAMPKSFDLSLCTRFWRKGRERRAPG